MDMRCAELHLALETEKLVAILDCAAVLGK
jgi:hypothetical protein